MNAWFCVSVKNVWGTKKSYTLQRMKETNYDKDFFHLAKLLYRMSHSKLFFFISLCVCVFIYLFSDLRIFTHYDLDLNLKNYLNFYSEDVLGTKSIEFFFC